MKQRPCTGKSATDTKAMNIQKIDGLGNGDTEITPCAFNDLNCLAITVAGTRVDIPGIGLNTGGFEVSCGDSRC